MSFSIRAIQQPTGAGDALKRFTHQEVKRANRLAINRALITVRTVAARRLSEKVNLKVNFIRDRYMRLKRVQASDPISTAEGTVSFSTKPIPMIYFVVGAKKPISQLGKRVDKRRKLRVQVMRGKRTTLPHSFIMRSGRAGYQVFTRTKGTLKLQRTRSVGVIVRDQGLGDELQTVARARYEALFVQILNATPSLRPPRG